MNTAEFILILFSVFLGIATGAGLYEARLIIPLWFNKEGKGYTVNHENLKGIDSGRKFWAFITTVPLTLLTLINFILALRSDGETQTLWLSAASLMLVERIATFTFFIPGIIRLQKKRELPEAIISNMVTRWIHMNYLRNAVTMMAWTLVLVAITLI